LHPLQVVGGSQVPVMVVHFGILVADPVHDFDFVRTLPECFTHKVMPEQVDRPVLEPDFPFATENSFAQGFQIARMKMAGTLRSRSFPSLAS
jgi:hypothetical protein